MPKLKQNPGLTIFANPRARGVTLSKRVFAIQYKHAQDGQPYEHKFKAGVTMELLPDGSIRIFSSSGKSLWGNF